MINPARSIVRVARQIVTWGAFSLVPALFAANGPPTVTVQGIVETLDDVMRTPFVVSASSGIAAEPQPTATIDIPTGKRLIIETIAFQATKPNGEAARIFLQPQVGGESLLIPLPIQTESVEGPTTYLISALPFKMRIDSKPGTTEISVRRGGSSPGILGVTVIGYLVDL